MTAFLVSFVAVGWRPGDAFPDGHIAAAASGAAFMTVVFAQTANAFACRSSTRWPGALGWTTNRLLIVGVSVGLAFSFVVLFVAPIADELGHAPPPAAGWMVAAASVGRPAGRRCAREAPPRRAERSRSRLRYASARNQLRISRSAHDRTRSLNQEREP